MLGQRLECRLQVRLEALLKVSDARRRHKRLQTDDAPLDELVEHGLVVRVLGHEPAPEGHIHVQLALGRGDLAVERGRVADGGVRVQRHVHDGCDASRSGSLGAGLKALPFLSPGLV